MVLDARQAVTNVEPETFDLAEQCPHSVCNSVAEIVSDIRAVDGCRSATE
ncbi:hypothetical protein OVA21_13640 [Dietzia sp. SL131]|nr:hypothetical protein [Dietzia sp. SL131]MCY1658229.1 hypothetical protein [Dietzia sp. SL131]